MKHPETHETVPESQPGYTRARPNNKPETEEVIHLVVLARKGDQSAMGQLYRIYRPMVRALVWRFTGGAAETEDLIQDSFLRAFRSITHFKADRASFQTWLYRITSNCCLDYLRRGKTRRTHMEEFYLLDTDRDSDLQVSPESLADMEQRQNLVRAAVTRLPAKQRMALVLRHFNGMPIREIASVMKCREGTVKRHLYRAVRRLRREIEHPGERNEM
ncbi:MAG: RNA polymerase sigma factor [Acidobacteriota bacterium]|jgi:RNA polymerase sigma-70 factor (ECF subfamily)|nr:RNA polymerase sigma factor [Acidobacteriota bacterium]